MKITKLHLLILLFLGGGGYAAHYFWQLKQTEIALRLEQEKQAQALQQQAEEARKKTEAEAAQAQIQIATTPAAAPAPVVEQPLVKAVPPKTKTVTYTIKSGDTLWLIARQKKHFGDGHRWRDIWKANKKLIPNSNRLPVGQEIVIPVDPPKKYLRKKTKPKKQKLSKVSTKPIPANPALPSDLPLDLPSDLPPNVLPDLPEEDSIAAPTPPAN